MKKTITRKAYIVSKEGVKHWFEISQERAEQILRLQKLIREESSSKPNPTSER